MQSDIIQAWIMFDLVKIYLRALPRTSTLHYHILRHDILIGADPFACFQHVLSINAVDWPDVQHHVTSSISEARDT